MERDKRPGGWFSWTKKLSGELNRTFRSFRNRNYKIYSIGQVFSLSGTWMQGIALSWLVYNLTGSAAALGMVSLAGGIPMLFLTWFGGVIADKFDHKKILYATVSLQMIQAALLTYLTFSGLINVYWIVGLSFFAGCVGAVEMPTRQSFVPDLVSREELANAIGINSSIRNLSRIIGPAVAGVLLGIFGEAICFGINSLSYVAALVALYLISVECQSDEECAEEEVRAESVDSKPSAPVGIRQILASPAVRNVLLFSAATSMFGFQFSVLLPVIASQVLSGDAAVLGYLSAGSGVGALLGSLLLASRGSPKALRRGIGFAGMLLSLSIILLAWSTWMPLSLMAVGFAGASVSLQMGGSATLIQSSVTKATRGRVMALFSTSMIGFAPFAAFMAGGLADLVGVSNTLYISGLAVFLTAALYLLVVKGEPEEAQKN